MEKCKDSGPARNHWFITREEGIEMANDKRFRPAGLYSVCDKSIKTYQLKNPVTGKVDARSFRHYDK